MTEPAAGHPFVERYTPKAARPADEPAPLEEQSTEQPEERDRGQMMAVGPMPR